MKIMTTDVNINGVKLMVEFYYQPYEAGDLETPPVAEQVEIEAIYVGSEEISELLEDRHEEIENLIFKNLRSC